MAVSAVKKDAKEAPKRDAAAAPAAPAQPKKKRGWLLPTLVLLVLAGAGAGGAWWYLNGATDGTEHGMAKTAPVKPPVFAPLEMFTVNLQLEEHPQYLQVGLTLKVAAEVGNEGLKQRMPEIRDSVLLLLSSKKASELLTLDGKRKLAGQIQASINAILAPGAERASAPAAVARTDAAAAPAAPVAADAATATPPAAPDAAAPAAAADTAPAAAPLPAGVPAALAPPAAPAGPVTAVLFTSFIVQ